MPRPAGVEGVASRRVANETGARRIAFAKHGHT